MTDFCDEERAAVEELFSHLGKMSKCTEKCLGIFTIL